MERIAVVDYGMGNLRSVAKALGHVAGPHQEILVTGRADLIVAADRVVFPGQGAMRDCMAEINGLSLAPAIREAASSRPFLGICMGLQVLMPESEEDPHTPGLGVLRGTVKRFPPPGAGAAVLKVPHMGWNNVRFTRRHPLWEGIECDTRFYFVHSYYVVPEDAALATGTTRYGVEFVCALASGSLFAVQFHPEKSQHAGLRLLKNFLSA